MLTDNERLTLVMLANFWHHNPGRYFLSSSKRTTMARLIEAGYVRQNATRTGYRITLAGKDALK